MELTSAVDDMKCAELFNSTNTSRGNITEGDSVYNKVFIFYTYALPTICICGFLGNVMNLVILAGKRIQRMFRASEKSASIGMIALAVADLSFCVSAFPSTFLPKDNIYHSQGFLLYYACFCAAVINIFIMTSTWLTVTLSTERYLAIRQPLKSRHIITLRRSKIVIIMVYVLSTLFNIPVFWRYKIEKMVCSPMVVYQVVVRGISPNFDRFYQSSWAAIGNFIPLIVLLFCNIGLMREIHKSYAMRKQLNYYTGRRGARKDDTNANRITLTLVAIVVMFLVCVAPSEVMKLVAVVLGGDYSQNHVYRTIEVLYNLLQTINFSANFVLYCAINPSFRKTMRERFCFHSSKLSNRDEFEHSFMDSTYQDRFSSHLRMNSQEMRTMKEVYERPKPRPVKTCLQGARGPSTALTPLVAL